MVEKKSHSLKRKIVELEFRIMGYSKSQAKRWSGHLFFN